MTWGFGETREISQVNAPSVMLAWRSWAALVAAVLSGWFAAVIAGFVTALATSFGNYVLELAVALTAFGVTAVAVAWSKGFNPRVLHVDRRRLAIIQLVFAVLVAAAVLSNTLGALGLGDWALYIYGVGLPAAALPAVYAARPPRPREHP